MPSTRAVAAHATIRSTIGSGSSSSCNVVNDPDGGKTWIDLPWTLQAKTTLTGQTPGTVLEFRYRWLTKTGETDWTAPISFTVK